MIGLYLPSTPSVQCTHIFHLYSQIALPSFSIKTSTPPPLEQSITSDSLISSPHLCRVVPPKWSSWSAEGSPEWLTPPPNVTAGSYPSPHCRRQRDICQFTSGRRWFVSLSPPTSSPDLSSSNFSVSRLRNMGTTSVEFYGSPARWRCFRECLTSWAAVRRRSQGFYRRNSPSMSVDLGLPFSFQLLSFSASLLSLVLRDVY